MVFRHIFCCYMCFPNELLQRGCGLHILPTLIYTRTRNHHFLAFQTLFSGVLGQNGPWTKRTRQNGPRFRTKRTTSQDKTDHVPGQNGPGFRTKWTTFLDKTGPVLGQTVPCKKIHDVLQRSEESSQYP